MKCQFITYLDSLQKSKIIFSMNYISIIIKFKKKFLRSANIFYLCNDVYRVPYVIFLSVNQHQDGKRLAVRVPCNHCEQKSFDTRKMKRHL